MKLANSFAMKYMITPLILIATLVMSSCSTCYECETEVVLTDGNQNPIDTTTNSEEFCTADSEEVTSRESDGADCRVQ